MVLDLIRLINMSISSENDNGQNFHREPHITGKSKEKVRPYSSFEEMLEATRKIAVNPVDFIDYSIKNKGVGVVSLGEQHNIETIESSEMAIIEELINRASLKNLALEIFKKYQVAIDKYLSEGEMQQLLKDIPYLNNKKDLQKLIKFAMSNGVNIHCVDDSGASVVQALIPLAVRSVRDRKIHNNILELARKNNLPLLAILGSLHTSHSDDATFHFIQDFAYPKLNDSLKEKYLPLAYCPLAKKHVERTNLSLPIIGTLIPTGIDKRFDVTFLKSISDYCGNYAGVIFVHKQ